MLLLYGWPKITISHYTLRECVRVVWGSVGELNAIGQLCWENATNNIIVVYRVMRLPHRIGSINNKWVCRSGTCVTIALRSKRLFMLSFAVFFACVWDVNQFCNNIIDMRACKFSVALSATSWLSYYSRRVLRRLWCLFFCSHYAIELIFHANSRLRCK